MIFSTNVDTRTYVVRREVWGMDALMNRTIVQTPLRAKFRGPQRIFDSELTQAEQGWSDQERRLVEAFLIEHADFMAEPVSGGVGVRARIYLGPGQEIPKEHRKRYDAALARRAPSTAAAVEAISEPEVPAQLNCMAFDTVKGTVVQCSKPAAPGSDLCEDKHKTPVAAAVS